MENKEHDRVAIMGGARTPFVKAMTTFSKLSALDLAVHSVNGLLSKQNLKPDEIEALAYGIVVLNPRIPHLAREVVFASTLPVSVRALTLTDNCITGASAMATLFHEIREGRINSGIAGGVESMSSPALMFGERAARIFFDAAAARNMGDRIKSLLKLRPWHFKPNAPDVAEPSTGMSMGEHCELMVKEWKVSRQRQDEIAWQSHQKAHAATEDGRLTAEIHPLQGVERDLLIRSGTTMEKLGGLKPVFDRSETGTITAGNSSALTDGAAALLMMSESRAKELNREPLAFVKDYEFVGIDPSDGLLMGPGIAVPRLLARHGLKLEDIDIVEVHEAFGGQVGCNLEAWKQGWKEPAVGEVAPEKLNPLGSSLAVGHPFAATGIRIATTLANEMKRRNSRYGLISICGAGATAAAMLLERDV